MRRYLIAGASLGAAVFALVISSIAAPSPLRPFERGSWREVVRTHAGRPTLVHFWGVTCGPCKVELPLLGQFMKQHPGIDVVTISADLAPNLPAATQSMLDNAGLSTAENFVFNDGYAERLRFEIDPSWQGDIPRTLLIGRDGAISTIEGTAETAELEKWSAEQLASPGRR